METGIQLKAKNPRFSSKSLFTASLQHRAKSPEFSRSMNKLHHAFTLVELLVVIAIIVMLLAASLIGIQGSKETTRDVRRKADLEAIREALELYKADNNVYPYSNPENACDSSEGSCGTACTSGTNSCGGVAWAAPMTNLQPNFIADLPEDSINDDTHFYYYEPVCNQTSTVCGVSKTCTGINNCCAYELGTQLEADSTWYRVCSP